MLTLGQKCRTNKLAHVLNRLVSGDEKQTLFHIFISRFQNRYDGIHRTTLYASIKTPYDILLLSVPIDEEIVRQTILSLMEANSYRVALHPLKITSERPLLEAASAGVCVVVSQNSYFQIEKDLLTMSKTFQEHIKPLVFIALDIVSAKYLRRLVDLKGYKILLWDNKTFWPLLKAIIPNQSKAVTTNEFEVGPSCTNDEDMWTYLKNSNAGSGESSLSTQSTGKLI